MEIRTGTVDVRTAVDSERKNPILVLFSTLPFACNFGPGAEIWVPISLHEGRPKQVISIFSACDRFLFVWVGFGLFVL